jgi:hypothetical protein
MTTYLKFLLSNNIYKYTNYISLKDLKHQKKINNNRTDISKLKAVQSMSSLTQFRHYSEKNNDSVYGNIYSYLFDINTIHTLFMVLNFNSLESKNIKITVVKFNSKKININQIKNDMKLDKSN